MKFNLEILIFILYVCAVQVIISILQVIKYPISLYKTAIQQGWEKPFALLFDLKAVFTSSWIKNYKNYDSIQPLLSKKIARETYFKYIHILNRLGYVKINNCGLRLVSYKELKDSFRYVKRCSAHLARMRAQIIRRICDKQISKIRTGSSIRDIKQVKEVCGSITFEVVNSAKTVTLSCRGLADKFNKSKSWGYKVKKTLREMLLISTYNVKDFYGKQRPLNYIPNAGFMLHRGIWVRQCADRIKAFIKLDEREKIVPVDLETKLRLIYCNDI